MVAVCLAIERKFCSSLLAVVVFRSVQVDDQSRKEKKRKRQREVKEC